MTGRTRNRIGWLAAAAIATQALVAGIGWAAPVELLARGSDWQYLDDGVYPGATWTEPGFDDSGWNGGPARLGYGMDGEATTVGYGPDAQNKFITTWFRAEFDVANPAALLELDMEMVRDDGAVIYLNGSEVFRSNMPAGVITPTTLANVGIGGIAETRVQTITVDSALGLLVPGTNVVAVEVHQSDVGSSDLGIDVGFIGFDDTPIVTRGPYLQRATPDSIVVRWRTDVATDSVVRFSAPGLPPAAASVAGSRTEHEVEITGLTPKTQYTYGVGSSTHVLAGGDPDHYFRTAPPVGSRPLTRIWAIGDSGTANASARAVRDAYLGLPRSVQTDVWLMLGDNAYNDGTDDQYQAAVFETYPTILRRTPLWATFGNHDDLSASSATQTGPYYDIFSPPTAGEAGGLPSGTEAYYAFDHANIHFVCLDSQGSNRLPGSAMLTWLAADLDATDQDWIIAFWHHPPYTDGSHVSDTESQLIQMRENALPILEAAGVDLVLSGHSHSYERSFLLDGHYGTSDTLTNDMIVDGGDGSPFGDGAYGKPVLGPAANAGAVYAVAGSSGKISGGNFSHPVMVISTMTLGSLVLDVRGATLEGRFVDSSGNIADFFTIEKPAPPAACSNGIDDDVDGLTDLADPECISAAWPWEEAPHACGLGVELVLALPLLAGIRRRASRRRSGSALEAARR